MIRSVSAANRNAVNRKTSALHRCLSLKRIIKNTAKGHKTCGAGVRNSSAKVARQTIETNVTHSAIFFVCSKPCCTSIADVSAIFIHAVNGSLLRLTERPETPINSRKKAAIAGVSPDNVCSLYIQAVYPPPVVASTGLLLRSACQAAWSWTNNIAA